MISFAIGHWGVKICRTGARITGRQRDVDTLQCTPLKIMYEEALLHLKHRSRALRDCVTALVDWLTGFPLPSARSCAV